MSEPVPIPGVPLEAVSIVRRAARLMAGPSDQAVESPKEPPKPKPEANAQTQESQSQPGPAKAVDEGGGEESVPIARFREVNDRMKRAESANQDRDKTDAATQKKVRELEAKNSRLEIQTGKRPDGFDEMDSVEQGLWLQEQQEKYRTEPEPVVDSDAQTIKEKWDLMEELNISPQQASAIHQAKKDAPGLNAEELMSLAASRRPDLFEVSQEPEGGPSVPPSHQMRPPSSSGTRTGVKKNTRAQAHADLMEGHRQGGDQKKLGVAYVKAMLKAED